ncbi:MAG: hypothetical protein JNM56_18480, partial [Planctomycetia bacterium]|nr:hypothetical protein [Planctomycetia bacterium]
MIYQFPDLNTLQMVITSSVVPPEITLAPAVAGLDEEGHVWVQPSAAVPKKSQTALRKLGVQTIETNGEMQAEEVSCWQQLLPVERDPQPPVLSNQAPVLFELTSAEQLPELVGEMLRLGNDRQSFRWLKDGKQERVLLRVIGPPYYSLLRALEPNEQEGGPRAYVERAPHVWVELGHTHALVDALKPPPGKMLFLRPPRDWSYLDEVAFRDIYEVLDFSLPDAKIAWKETAPGKRLTVPLRLAPSGGTPAAELWVLRERAYEIVDLLVREAEDALLNRLSFAVGEHRGETSIVLRVRPSKQPPPVLQLAAPSFRPYQKMPNLFMPIDKTLKPPLRRDAVRQLLADDPDKIVWLYPGPDGSFAPQSLPDSAFRPLRDWVDYVLDREHDAVQTWIDAARFEFGSYICKDDPQQPKPPRGKAPRDRKSMLAQEVEDEDATPAPTVVEKPKKKTSRDADEFAPLPDLQKSELQEKLGELEKQFLSVEGALDEPDRQALWPRMAELHAQLDQKSDAAICWLNAVWEYDRLPADTLWQWAQLEAGFRGRQMPVAELDRWLTLPNPTAVELRTVVAVIVAAAWDESAANRQAIVQRLPRLHRFLEQHEVRLGVRAVWLAWSSLAKLSSGDVLALARTRDRLLERLLNSGLSTEYDLPSFMRFSGQHASEKFRVVRDRVVRLRELAQRWITLCHKDGNGQGAGPQPTQAYKDLMFAFGMARLGEANEARRVQEAARLVLAEQKDEVHDFLLSAYCFRIDQALAGKPHSGPLPAAQMEALQKKLKDDRFKLFKVDRLRASSHILEPQEQVDAYRSWRANVDELAKELSRLFQLSDRGELEAAITKLLKAQKKPKEQQRVLAAALELAPRVSEAFTVDLLAQLLAARDSLTVVQDSHELEQRAKLLERALFLAAHFDRVEFLQQLVASFMQLLESQRGDNAAQALDTLAGQCLRGLRKLGLRDEIGSLLQRMTDIVMQGQSLKALRERQGANWVHSLRTLLQIAGGWLYFNRMEQAMPILDEARGLLFDENAISQAVFRAKLACSYALTLGQAPPELALKRLEEMFNNLGKLSDTFTTNSHYALFQLQVVEAVVRAVVSDDFAVGQNVRRWLDEDEYLVRRRVHHDLKTYM